MTTINPSAPSSPPRAAEPTVGPKSVEAQAWREAMLGQILNQMRQHEPRISQAAQGQAPAPAAAPLPHRGRHINCYA